MMNSFKVNRYIKKPVVVQAIQYIGEGQNIEDITEFCKPLGVEWVSGNLIINTLEGQHIANFEDYIIKGVEGECYPCKPDIFHKTYSKYTGTNIKRQE